MFGRLSVCLALAASRVNGAVTAGAVHRQGSIGAEAKEHESALLQTWGRALDEASDASKTTPVTRVVNLLKEMQATLQKEMEEDEDMYKKMGCWCNNNKYEKDGAITAATAKVAELESTIKASTASSAELKERLEEVNGEIAAAKKALAESEKLRKEQAASFHKEEIETIEAIENIKAALMVLQRNAGSAFPQLDLSLLSTSSHRKEIPWSDDHESDVQRSFGEFMRNSGLSDTHMTPESRAMIDGITSDTPAATHFLQNQEQRPAPVASAGVWSAEDKAIVRRALKSASSFVQGRHGSNEFQQSLGPGTDQILGVLKQMKDEMEASLSSARSAEADAAATAHEMMTAKKTELESNEKQNERIEDELAEAKNTLAEAKEDLDQTNAALTADQKFMVNLKKMCSEAGTNFDQRKAARLEEVKAVSETIDVLMADGARDTFSNTYSFMQTAQLRTDVRRQQAAAVLRKVHEPGFSVLATSVELDSFTRVKKAIDDMIVQLKTQQADEVKKSDWCNAEFKSNDMSTMRETSTKGSLEAKISDLESTLDKLSDEVAAAKKDIAQLQLDLQRGTETRKQANMDFQKTVADQRATQDILKKALEKLATFYDLAQTKSKGRATQAHTTAQTPPVAEMKYEKSAGASGVMSMIEKLIADAKQMEKRAFEAEVSEQKEYEALVADTNDSIAALQKLIVTKTSEQAETKKEKIDADSDLKDSLAELEGLAKYDADLHGDCDYILKNFDTRQEARGKEIEALQQAKSILSGAAAR